MSLRRLTALACVACLTLSAAAQAKPCRSAKRCSGGALAPAWIANGTGGAQAPTDHGTGGVRAPRRGGHPHHH